MGRSETLVAMLLALALLIAPVLRADPVDEVLAREMKKQHIPGMSVAVVRSGKLVKAQGYGLADVELGAPASDGTLYEIASLTKPFTAAAAMILVERGKLRLDDPIGRYLPQLQESWKRVTVRQLLTHTGGIPLNPFRLNPSTERLEYTRGDILKCTADMPLLFEPGARFSYSNLGYYLLGAVIEEASGTSYAAFMDAQLFKPLGMTATRVNDYATLIPNRARGYEWRGELRRGAYQSPSSYAPAGGIVSSAADLAKWETAVSIPALLKGSTLEQLWTPAPVANGTYPYGLGWNLDHVRGRRDYNHRGSNAGFSSTFHRYVDDRVTIILLANLSAADLERVSRAVAGCYLPELQPLSSMQSTTDPHPNWTEALRQGLAKLSRNEPDVIFSDDFYSEFKRFDMSRALSARLEFLKSLKFLGSAKVRHWNSNRPGGVVERLELYRMVTGSRLQGYVFEVDASGRILWIDMEEDAPRAEEIIPSDDDNPALSGRHRKLSIEWAAGRANDPEMTPGLRQAFSQEAVDYFRTEFARASGLQFLCSRDVRGDGATRLGNSVTAVRYYRILRPGPPLFLVCHLTSDGLLADVELTQQ